MTRSVPLRRSPLSRGTKRLRRRKPLRAVNPTRKARLYERNFGAYSDFVALVVKGNRLQLQAALGVLACGEVRG